MPRVILGFEPAVAYERLGLVLLGQLLRSELCPLQVALLVRVRVRVGVGVRVGLRVGVPGRGQGPSP